MKEKHHWHSKQVCRDMFDKFQHTTNKANTLEQDLGRGEISEIGE